MSFEQIKDTQAIFTMSVVQFGNRLKRSRLDNAETTPVIALRT